jgi:hypothetical protein
MIQIWKRWHLNDTRAGSQKQEEFLREYPISGTKDRYDLACSALDKAGLLIDNGYKYGSAWIHEQLPSEVISEIKSWI